MSGKTRQKKDGEDKNKNNQRMKEVESNADKKNAASSRQDKAGPRPEQAMKIRTGSGGDWIPDMWPGGTPFCP